MYDFGDFDLPSFDADLIKHTGKKPDDKKSNVNPNDIKRPEKKVTPDEKAPEKQSGGSSESQTETPVTSDYRESVKLDPQRGGGEQTQSEIVSQKPKKTGRFKTSKGVNAQYKDVPRNVADYISKCVPNAPNRLTELVAFVYLKSGCIIDIPDNIREIAEEADAAGGDGVATSLNGLFGTVEALDERIMRLEKTMERLEFMMAAMLCDQRAYMNNIDRNVPPRDAEFNLPAIDDLTQRIQEQANELKQTNIRREHSSVNYYRNKNK